MSSTHRDYCRLATRWLLKQSWCDIASWEIKYKRGIVDAVGISRVRANTRRISVIEVKRTRADLLADLRSKKLLKYEQGASHCYLAATPKALRFPLNQRQKIFADLEKRGLPKHWGVLAFVNGDTICLRPARSLRRIAPSQIQALMRKIARSLCYKAIKGTI